MLKTEIALPNHVTLSFKSVIPNEVLMTIHDVASPPVMVALNLKKLQELSMIIQDAERHLTHSILDNLMRQR